MAEREIEPDEIDAALRALRVPLSMLEVAREVIPKRSLGVVVYGSFARGDFVGTSDLDLLAVRAYPAGTIINGDVSLTTYTPDQLRSASGTLFGMHLRRDARVLCDAGGVTEQLLTGLASPDPSQLQARIRHLAGILDASPVDLETCLAGLTRMSRYLLRTSIYVAELDRGRPCFSIREIAEARSQPELEKMLASRPEVVGEPTKHGYWNLCGQLQREAGSLKANPHGSLRNLIVAEWFEDPDRASLGVLALPRVQAEFDYAAIRKVLL